MLSFCQRSPVASTTWRAHSRLPGACMIRKAKTQWHRAGKDGMGNLSSDSGGLAAPCCSFKTGFQGEKGINPTGC